MRAWRVAACGVAAASAAALMSNCFVEGFVLVETGPQTSTGGADAGSDADADADPGCQHALWPDPPDAADPGSDTEEFVVASRMLSFDEDEIESGQLLGYDLDNRCTCQGEGPSCNPPAWVEFDQCDGPEGRDNAWALIFDTAGVFDETLTSAAFSEEMEQGQFSLLIRVSQYNGQANDDSVTLALYPSTGFDKDPCNGVDPIPAWDGTDRWPVLHTALLGSGGSGGSGVGAAGAGGGSAGGAGGCGGGAGIPPGYDLDQPRFVDEQAYVTDHYVVANLPDVAIVLSGDESATSFTLTAGFLTGRLEQQGSPSRWVIRDGLLVGRWALTEVFRTLSSLASGGEQICTDHILYPLVKNAVCKFPDIASSLGGPTTPCDAISFGMAFEADPAELGIVYIPAGVPTVCPPETDPANDSCDQ